ncbi:MAG: twin-arginine translocase TatA/TatE family subunit [Candidatus Gastranaerophilaceae bacterium]
MSLGITEILLILVAIALLFGGKRIPEIARAERAKRAIFP